MTRSRKSKSSNPSQVSVRLRSNQKACAASVSPKKILPVSASTAEPSASTLLDHTQLTTDEWYKSQRTTKAYASYVKSGKTWLEEWTQEDRRGLEDEQNRDDVPEERSVFAGAFDKIGAQTPTVLRLLTAYKCDHLGYGFSTAEGLRSAFKLYFELVHGCQGEFWRYNSYSQEWEGNPVFDTEFKVYYESLKNRDRRTATTIQALPMLPQDLKTIMEYLDRDDVRQNMSETRRLYFKAFASTAFCLWTRNDELINLQMKHVKTDQISRAGNPYIEFTLVFRKTNKDPNKAQCYMIPLDLDHPEIDCYSHIVRWLAHLQLLLQRPAQDDDYVFPAIASTGLLKFGEHTSRSGFETLMDTIVEPSGVAKGRNGRFTTHCFRRGGAQYRFMWAGRKWSLKAVKWWGGWSSSENVGTIMRYLLDELMSYEEGFGDIMMGDRAMERHETFMGTQDRSTSISRGDLLAFEARVMQQVRDLSALLANQSPTSKRMVTDTPITFPTLPSPESLPRTPSTLPPSPELFSAMPPHSNRSTPDPLQLPQHRSSVYQGPPRIPEVNSMDDVLSYWEHGDSRKGLTEPLKRWSLLYKPHEYRSEAQKLSMIGILYSEFTVHCKQDWVVFEENYPGLRRSYTKLLKAVRNARVLRGDAKTRRKRRK